MSISDEADDARREYWEYRFDSADREDPDDYED
jgi:hypothetical protein